MIIDRKPHALLRPGIAIPFLIVALIWGSTWFVIKDQLGDAPPSWSVTYRFALATIAMFALSQRERRGFSMTLGGHVMAFGIGFTQFFCNFNFVYRAEIHLTSGIVAVMFALLMVPNALLGRIFLGSRITARFMLGTVVALGGIAMLLVHEGLTMGEVGNIRLGILFTVLGIMSASIANVMQASDTAKRRPLILLLAWAMLWGTVFDATFAYGVAGPPVFPQDLTYWSGVGFLAILGSVVTFPLYFKLIRELGPGRAAYNGVMVPVVAMALSTLFEGYNWTVLNTGGAVLAMAGMVIALRGRHQG